MTLHSLSPEAVAHFLQENPSFFHEHANIFADLRVPHPHEARAISLGERQILTLRAKAKDLEWKLSGLVNNASGNEKISRTLTAWCARMLAEPDALKLPEQIVSHLAALFELPATQLKLWGLATTLPEEYTSNIDENIQAWATQLTSPYCGVSEKCPAARWFEPDIRSMAAVPLKAHASNEVLGLLVLGSTEPARFTADMGTAFLEILGELAGSALTRLKSVDV